MVTLLHAVAVGFGFTVTVPLAVSEQEPIDTITEYVVLEAGETKIGFDVLPLLHEYVAPPEAISVAFCPAQMVVLFATATGGGETVTVMDVVLVQVPFAVETV